MLKSISHKKLIWKHLIIYYTPCKLFKWGYRVDSKCPRCQAAEADIVHMLASCSAIREYWTRIMAFMADVTGTPIDLTSSVIMLGYDELGQAVSPVYFIAIMVGRLILAREWVSVAPPVFQQWSNAFFACFYQERSLYVAKGCKSRAKRVRIWGAVDAWFALKN